ncbi:HD domain-containing phosphohydrolase [Clostridium saccharobutylicum]|uniref:Cyclic di-GMP phosphodiesterase response regulator RpfG n=2 Tax=Clostridium saccharobutylicum TaxID=169679 RepID=U5MXJ4_CLOSA|nr:HD domain-containing phosphohydrolase [Clostridium saccharobutylicum]AGX44341.1 cyclic di-GMP phosphodiesterase response regulator RpfG [Clostridium saccharobutylicum DSM 13864]AQR91633.1 cyclic di-GMP phosphodiesterase response regulator RpfG [Clostridium saccharobutylicum]AQS01538.1 cyclic di-GMP phosphodiesterase response regulator RpfG [Clostridium saccharobutylicum]AQS15521.1 cyclic di-GMP phosphodiesterase response regulator RpfG [Clostridium saccharobutylicum]MBA2906946.1 diguanylate
MSDSNKLDIIIKLLLNLIKDKEIEPYPSKELLEVEGFESLYNTILEIRNAVNFISRGEVGFEIKETGYLPDVAKNLQVSMKNLACYIKAVSLGDFSKKIDSKGEIADSFNQMTKQLELIFNEISDLESEATEAKKHFEQIFSTSPETTVITRLNDGLIVNVNQVFCETFGYEMKDVIGKCPEEIGIYKDSSDRQKLINEIKTKGYCKNLKVILTKKGGEPIVALISAKIIKLKGISHLILVVRDITFRNKLVDALNQSEKKYRLLFENAMEMIMVFQKGKIKICNPIAEKVTGYYRSELISRQASYFIHPDDKERIINDHTKLLKGEAVEDGSNIFRIVKKDNTIRWIEMKSIRIEWENEDATLNLLSDITERKLAEEEIEFLSYHDQLTGLYNRRFYEKEIERLNMDKKYYPLSIIMADVNGLKLTNDAFGHIAGDRLLVSISKILKRKCRKNDIVARIGGDEFVILLPNTDAEDARSIINRIDEAITNEDTENIVLSVSMGLAVKKDVFDDIHDVFKKAEDNMYKYKLSKSENMKKKTIDRAIEKLYKNKIEAQHSKNVSIICGAIAYELKLNPDQIKNIKIAGLMHDIGKITIDEDIINKPGELSKDEWDIVKRHPEIGYHILNTVDKFSQISRFVLEHHEQWDGSGYPKGLKGNEISLQSRIIAIADSFDDMTIERPYKKASTVEEAINEIKQNAGIKFDPFIVKVFIDKVVKKIQRTYDN